MSVFFWHKYRGDWHAYYASNGTSACGKLVICGLGYPRDARIVPPKSHRCVACDAHISTNLDSAIEAEIAEAQQNLRDAADCCARGEGIEALACITTALQSWAVARDHLKGYPE